MGQALMQLRELIFKYCFTTALVNSDCGLVLTL